MVLIPIVAGPIQTNAYVVAGSDSECVFIDAPPDSSEQFSEICKVKQLNPKAVLLTHTHWDHSADAGMIKEEFGCPVYVKKEDAFRLDDPNKHAVVPLPFQLDKISPDEFFEDNQILKLAGLELKVHWTPGHTEGSVCFSIDSEKILFSGDTLFKDSMGRVDLPGGSEEKIKKSLKRISETFDEDFQVYSGHGPITLLGDELKSNPFLQKSYLG